MAYIPPNLRRSKDPQRPSPVPEMLEPIFNRKLKLGSSKHDAGASTNCIEYGDHAVHRSFVCGLDNNKSISSDHFEEVPEEPDEQKRSVTINLATDNDKACANTSRSPWESIAANVWPDVLSACNIVKNEMEEKPKMVARFGNILFDEHISVVAAGNKCIHCLSTATFLVRETNQSVAMARNDLLSLESASEHQVAETAFKAMRTCFDTGVPATYMEKIVHKVVPKIGVDFVQDKDIYHVQDDDMSSIRILINSAIPDPKVKGGLRWPVGKSYSGNYTVVGVWHNEFKSYKSPSLKLKVRNVDRFLFKAGTGVATIEINLKFRRIISDIQDGEIDPDSIYNGFKDKLRLIWDHFLSWED
ncbi:hypothetical protein KPL71_009613 [Citrus sinensis]|uniref:Uncharacterized protein n=1 Tax=Citrus sinensis TaxID=2711 RepID=A0ACB8MFI4_CITSI|nr:hypothetical protein KPL71_009613 [Citrus sinensis]